MIVATAGHIDHGKTALVKALTGIDADRLPEEKARGITLDLGFAYARFGDARLGFVDVPGHERLVRTMVAGASGVDCALLVVAADDGVMPQTREHIAILDLLGLTRGAVALTKADRADAARLVAVEAEIRAELGGTGLHDAPVIACSSLTRAGIADLGRWLERQATAIVDRDPGEAGFRLAVDRSFTLAGVGLVVTGAVHDGRVRVGDRLLLSPGDVEVRVRGIRVGDAAVEDSAIGERCALNLTGPRLSKAGIHRGDWILAPELHAPTTRLDVALRVQPGEAKQLRHRTPVRVHLGAASVTGRVLLSSEGALDPGASALAQLSLDAPIGTLARDRFVLRDISARRTIGGGRVVDPLAPRRGARTPQRQAVVAALAEADDAAALTGLLAAVETGIDLDHFRRVRNLGAKTQVRLLDRFGIVAVAGPTGRLGFADARIAGLRADLIATLDALHAREPDNPGLDAAELAATIDPALRPALRTALDGLCEADRLHRRGSLYHRPGHVVRLQTVDDELWRALRARMAAAALDPPRLAHLAEAVALPPDAVRPLLDKLGRIGWLVRVSHVYYLLPAVLSGLADHARAVAAAHPDGLLTVGRFREATGIGRNAAMPVLEHLDAAGFTERVPEGRRIRADRACSVLGSDEGSGIDIGGERADLAAG